MPKLIALARRRRSGPISARGTPNTSLAVGGMNVGAFEKRLLQRVDPRHMRGKAQFDLAVIGRDQHMARLGDEGAADFAAFLGAHRNVLQIGLVRRHPPGQRVRQPVGRVDAAQFRVDLLDQRVGVGAFELGELAPVEHPRRQIVRQRQFFEDRRIGAVSAELVLAAARQAQFVEQHFAQLLGRADIEGVAGELMDFGFRGRRAAW